MEKQLKQITIFLVFIAIFIIYFLVNFYIATNTKINYSRYEFSDERYLLTTHRHQKPVQSPPIWEITGEKGINDPEIKYFKDKNFRQGGIYNLKIKHKRELWNYNYKKITQKDFKSRFTLIALTIPAEPSSNKRYKMNHMFKGLREATRGLPVEIWNVRATLNGDKSYGPEKVFSAECCFDRGMIVDPPISKKEFRMEDKLTPWVSDNFYPKNEKHGWSHRATIFLLVDNNARPVIKPFRFPPLKVALVIRDLMLMNNEKIPKDAFINKYIDAKSPLVMTSI